MGLEPTTARLRAARSTDWARKATDDTHSTCLFFQYSHDASRLSYTHWHTTLHIYIHITILIPLYMTSRLYTIFSTPDFSDPFSLSALYISFIYVLFSPLLMSLFPSVLALPPASFSSPFHSLPFTLSSCVLFSSPFSCLIYFLPHSSLGSFRGSVGRAIGC